MSALAIMHSLRLLIMVGGTTEALSKRLFKVVGWLEKSCEGRRIRVGSSATSFRSRRQS